MMLSVSDGKLTDKLERMWKEMVTAYLTFAWSGYRKPQNPSVKIAGVAADI
jgi:hypothetical protein